jgi:hypothetical protein
MEAFHQFNKEAVFNDMRYHKNLLLPFLQLPKMKELGQKI